MKKTNIFLFISHNDLRINELIKDYGVKGYGQIAYICSELYGTKVGMLPLENAVFEAFADVFCSDISVVKKFIVNNVDKYKLLSKDERFFWNDEILEAKEKQNKISLARKNAVKNRWAKALGENFSQVLDENNFDEKNDNFFNNNSNIYNIIIPERNNIIEEAECFSIKEKGKEKQNKEKKLTKKETKQKENEKESFSDFEVEKTGIIAKNDFKRSRRDFFIEADTNIISTEKIELQASQVPKKRKYSRTKDVKNESENYLESHLKKIDDFSPERVNIITKCALFLDQKREEKSYKKLNWSWQKGENWKGLIELVQLIEFNLEGSDFMEMYERFVTVAADSDFWKQHLYPNTLAKNFQKISDSNITKINSKTNAKNGIDANLAKQLEKLFG